MEGNAPISASRLVVKLLSELTSVTMAVDDEYSMLNPSPIPAVAVSLPMSRLKYGS
jgi:hypothetical protein